MSKVAEMPKKKTAVPDGREERKPVQIPASWFALLRRLSADKKQPHTWYLLDLLNREAEAAGYDDIPPLPWEEDDPSMRGV